MRTVFQKSMWRNQHTTQWVSALISLPLMYHENGQFSFAKPKISVWICPEVYVEFICRPWAQILLDTQSPGNLLPLGQAVKVNLKLSHTFTITVPTLSNWSRRLIFGCCIQKQRKKPGKKLQSVRMCTLYVCRCNDKGLNFGNCCGNKLDWWTQQASPGMNFWHGILMWELFRLLIPHENH